MENRRARFRTVIALVDDEVEHVFEGEVGGTITIAPRGTNGFGYAPVFLPEQNDPDHRRNGCGEQERHQPPQACGMEAGALSMKGRPPLAKPMFNSV